MTTTKGVMTRWQAVFLGVGAMIGAGIFALLGEAGAIALSAVWLSFLIAGLIAALQGYSFTYLAKKHVGGVAIDRRNYCSLRGRRNRPGATNLGGEN